MKAKKYTRETISDIGITDRGFPEFRIGDTIAVSQRIKEGNKERIQVFEGDVLAMHKQGASTTFTVRKIGANAISVEKIFPYYSPLITKIKLVKRGRVRRAKLYYMRKRIGRASRIEELIQKKQESTLDSNQTPSPEVSVSTPAAE